MVLAFRLCHMDRLRGAGVVGMAEGMAEGMACDKKAEALIMDPLRLHFFLACALTSCGLSAALAQALFTQALRQYYARWPLAGCGVKYESQTTYVVAVGRN